MKIIKLAAVGSLSILLTAALFGQDPPPAPDQGGQVLQPGQLPPSAPPLDPQQLQDLVAPIALYPDNLLSQILAASTYPIEIVEAQQWLQQNRNLKGQALMDAAKQQNWDPSVQALVAFPDVLTRLNQDIRWTTDLGNAFLAQQPDVMHAVQQLRAQGAGQRQVAIHSARDGDYPNSKRAIGNRHCASQSGGGLRSGLQSRMGLGTALSATIRRSFIPASEWASHSYPESIWGSTLAAAGACGAALDGDGAPTGSADESC